MAGLIPGGDAVVDVLPTVKVAGQRILNALLAQYVQAVKLLPSAPALLEGTNFQVLGIGYTLQQGIRELD